MSFAFSGPLPTDGVTALAAASVNNPFNDLKTFAINHQLGTGSPAYRHLTAAIDSEALTAGPTYSDAQVTLQARVNQLAAAFPSIIGVAGFSASIAAIPTTLTAINTTLTGATALATNNALVKRDASGGAAFGGTLAAAALTATPTTATAAVIARNQSTNTGITLVTQNAAGTANELTVSAGGVLATIGTITATGAISGPVAATTLAASGATTLSGTLAVTGAVTLTAPLGAASGGTGATTLAAHGMVIGNGTGAAGTLAPGAANNVVSSNGTDFVSTPFANTLVPVGTLTQDRLAALFASPATGAGNALRVAVNPGQPWNGAAYLQFAGGNSPAIDPTGIGAGNSRIDLLVINASGNLAWVQGTAGASPTPPALGSAQVPIWYVKTYSASTSVTGYTDTGANSFLYADARAVFLNPTGQGASSSSAPLLATYITDADETASLANSKRILNLWNASAAGYTGTNAPLFKLSTAATDAVLMDLMQGESAFGSGQGAIPNALRIATSTTVSLTISGPPATLVIGNAIRKVTGTITSNAVSGAAGARYLYADTANGAAAGTFVLWFSTSATPTATQRLLGHYYFDGAALHDVPTDVVDFGPAFGVMEASQIRPIRKTLANSPNVAISTTGWTYLGVNVTLYADIPMNVMVSGEIGMSPGAAGALATVATQYLPPGGAWGNVGSYNQGFGAVYQQPVAIAPYVVKTTLAGLHQFTVAVTMAAGTGTLFSGHITIDATAA